MASRKIIISCAVTGSIHTPSMSPHLPVTAAEIAASALAAAEAGAAIVHLHARNPKDGRPDQSPEAFEPFLRVIKQRSNVVVNLTTGGSPYMTVEERVKPAAVWKPEVASLNMGSMNFGLFPMLKRYKTFKHDWEPAMLEGSRDLVFRNSFKDIRYALETLNDTGARYEFECYDTSHLYNLHYFWTEGLVKAPLFIQTVFGLLGGIGAHPEDVMHMKRTADRLFGDNYRWSVLGAGRAQMPIAAMAAAMGGNVRVGLEDSLWIGAGKLAQSNADQVTQVRKIIEGLGLEVATPDEAREILTLKGGDKVAILNSIDRSRRGSYGIQRKELRIAMLPHRGVYDEEHQQFRESVRRFAAAKIAPDFQRWEDAGIIDRSLWAAGGASRTALPASPRRIRRRRRRLPAQRGRHRGTQLFRLCRSRHRLLGA